MINAMPAYEIIVFYNSFIALGMLDNKEKLQSPERLIKFPAQK